MNNKLDTKWKRFSVALHFSSHDENITPEAVFDILTACTDIEEWSFDLNDMNVVIWHPFEDMHWEDLRDSLETTAEQAQQYD